jgi:dienelactone hydrolase
MVTLQITPDHPLMDERIGIRIAGLRPKRAILVTARTRSQDGLWWRSHAIFTSDSMGEIDLAAQAPVTGSYRGVDVMGLFWSMSPDAKPRNAEHGFFEIKDPSIPLDTELQVWDDAQLLAEANVVRSYGEYVVRASPAGNGVTGILYSPSDTGTHPAVLVIGGSDGGLGAPAVAMLLAAHGFTALSIAYFGLPGLPSSLEAIPMEDFTRAIDWLSRQPGVDSRFVAIYGESRGSEPALWVAANAAAVNAVVVRSPSHVLWGGVTAHHLPGAAAWTWHGRSPPYIPNHLSIGLWVSYGWDLLTARPVSQRALFLDNLKAFGDTADIDISVENIDGPILVLAGKDDQIWPSDLMARRIMARLREHGHAFADQLLEFENVGHPIPYLYVPINGDRQHSRFAVGGTVQGTVKAQAEAWPRIIAFLQSAARNSNNDRNATKVDSALISE